ncbi:hypothetical protein [Desulfosporosinus sp. HMP52]|uniref:hypothetical protein n=1 Tax=Desulfosporosinus sp. HMP52 TaxID=1487923 RepID=UPI000A7930D7|nr:hypothetical protein [Desulfosporosinus sp. HMP52]
MQAQVRKPGPLHEDSINFSKRHFRESYHDFVWEGLQVNLQWKSKMKSLSQAVFNWY